MMLRGRFQVTKTFPRANTRYQHRGVLLGQLGHSHEMWPQTGGHVLRPPDFVPDFDSSETEDLFLHGPLPLIEDLP